MVVWQSALSALPQETGTSIQGRLLGSNGVPLAEQFQVNSTLGGAFETDINVTELDDGGFLVVWATPEVNGRRFAANGTPIGVDFQINSSSPGNESDVSAATHKDGRVLVVWKDFEAGDDGTEIYGRLLSSMASPTGTDFQINTSVTGSQVRPSVANYDENGFFVIWEGPSPPGSDNEPNGISARVVTGFNQFNSVEFQMNQWTADSQSRPTAYGRNGRVITAWSSQSNSGTSNSTIQGRGWAICGIFCDGFE